LLSAGEKAPFTETSVHFTARAALYTVIA